MANKTITDLPLMSPASVTVNDCVPMSDTVTVTTKRIKLSDIPAIPNFFDTADIPNSGLAPVATSTIKGRVTAGTGDVQDLTGTQAATILPAFTGDSGSGGVKGSVPAPASGDAAAGKVLGAGGTWVVPASRAPTVQKFTSGSGTYSRPSPAPLYIRVRMIGGGGGGATAVSNTVAGAGGSGGYIDSLITSPSATYSYGVGAGGTGGGNPAGNGGDTTFGTNTAGGGHGGSRTSPQGGVGGTVTLSLGTGLAIPGSGGGVGPQAGSGGNPGGQGGPGLGGGGLSPGDAGTDANGGNGAANTGAGGNAGSEAAGVGGAGGSGVIIVEEFYQ